MGNAELRAHCVCLHFQSHVGALKCFVKKNLTFFCSLSVCTAEDSGDRAGDRDSDNEKGILPVLLI